jgi:hypothetical protein
VRAGAALFVHPARHFTRVGIGEGGEDGRETCRARPVRQFFLKGIVMRKYLLSALALAMLGLLAAPVEAQVYKWKDEQGRTVISDTPRPGSGQQEPVVPPTPASSKAKPTESLADKELAFRQRQQERREAAAKAKQEKAAAAQRAEKCQSSRNYLKALEAGRRFTNSNEKGERVYMDDTQRQQRIERVRKEVRDFCN